MGSKGGWCCLAVAILAAGLLSACAEFYGKRQSRYTSSVVDYLYPEKQIAEVASIPHLSLPLRVGVAFVPDTSPVPLARSLSEKEKMDLMDRISSEFRSLPFVADIELIPTAYLVKEGGFANLDQIRTIYGIDVIALLSYDQVQHTDEGLLSLSYWTIVGAYIVKGEKNDTSTMMDAVVFDIASRKMLFRAPSTSHIKGSSTLVNLSEQLRKDSLEGFRLAADHLVANLHAELKRFQAKIDENPDRYVVAHRQGDTGGGSVDGVSALILLILGAGGLWCSKETCRR